jgi:hypothetical protein
MVSIYLLVLTTTFRLSCLTRVFGIASNQQFLTPRTMSDHAIQVQWDLTSSVGTFFQIGLKYLEIASSDNVQPLALIACEQFGVTLPICRATRKVIEKEAHSKKDPVFLSFAKAMIKQGGGESINQLASNVAGLNFLALAAALVSSTGRARSLRHNSAYDGQFCEQQEECACRVSCFQYSGSLATTTDPDGVFGGMPCLG